MKDDRRKADFARRFNMTLRGESEPPEYNQWLRNARYEMGLSQPEMADYIGIGAHDYRNFEWGVGRTKAYGGVWSNPAKDVASFFGVEPNEIFGDGPNGVEPHDAVLIQGDYSRGSAVEASEVYERGEWKHLLDEALKGLPEREEKILRMRFGLGEKPSDGMTLVEVGRVFKLTRERIRMIEAKALGRLRGWDHWTPERERLLAFDPEEADVIRRPCGECHRESIHECFLTCKVCGKKSCPSCWPGDGGMCWGCVARSNYVAQCEERFQQAKEMAARRREREAEERKPWTPRWTPRKHWTPPKPRVPPRRKVTRGFVPDMVPVTDMPFPKEIEDIIRRSRERREQLLADARREKRGASE